MITALTQLQSLLCSMDNQTYTAPLPVLSNASIGQHTRHILELYQILISSYKDGMIDYDNRERNLALQNDIAEGKRVLETIIESYQLPDKKMSLSSMQQGGENIDTSFKRELLYNSEHCIHHLALIRIGCDQLGISIEDDTFGVAPSTVKYRNQCVPSATT